MTEILEICDCDLDNLKLTVERILQSCKGNKQVSIEKNEGSSCGFKAIFHLSTADHRYVTMALKHSTVFDKDLS